MSNLWINAALDGVDYGEPPEEYVRQTKHDYLRSHYDDPEYNDADVVANKHIHDHYDDRGPYTTKWCHSTAEDCTHPLTDKKMRDLAQQNWDHAHRKLFYPEEHAKAEQAVRGAADLFLSDYRLDHPDRVFRWNPDGTLDNPDDPRIKGS